MIYNWRCNKSSFKSFSLYFLFAQGIPLLFTIFIVLMDELKPNIPLPNVGEYSCFIGSEYMKGKSFFTASEFFYYYLIVLIIITFNIICFLVTAFNLCRHRQAMTEIQTTRWGQFVKIKLKIILFQWLWWPGWALHHNHKAVRNHGSTLDTWRHFCWPSVQ